MCSIVFRGRVSGDKRGAPREREEIRCSQVPPGGAGATAVSTSCMLLFIGTALFPRYSRFWRANRSFLLQVRSACPPSDDPDRANSADRRCVIPWSLGDRRLHLSRATLREIAGDRRGGALSGVRRPARAERAMGRSEFRSLHRPARSFRPCGRRDRACAGGLDGLARIPHDLIVDTSRVPRAAAILLRGFADRRTRRGRLRHRVVRVRRSSWRSRVAGAPVRGSVAGGQRHHGDAVLDRADVDAEVAADAFARRSPRNGGRRPSSLRDRLVRGVLAGDVAAAALDAEVLVDARLGDVVEVEVLPVGDVAARRGRRNRRRVA